MMGNYHARCGAGEKPEVEMPEAYLSLFSLPDDFDKILSVMRSREVSVSIILQNLAQLKALFEKQWESIMGNCDEFLYLGGNEQGTHKYVSELLGKATIDTNTYGKSTGHSGNYSTNYQNTGRELMSRDELAVMDGSKCILQLRGVRPFFSDKFDITKHKRYKELADYDKKNEFDVEKYLEHKLVLSKNELFEVFETEVIDEDLQELEKDMMEGDVENE